MHASPTEHRVVKLHRCPSRWLKFMHPCWTVQKALDEAGIEYELVIGPLPRRKRSQLARLSGQFLYPVIQHGRSTYRDNSKKMAQTIREGRLWEKLELYNPDNWG